MKKSIKLILAVAVISIFIQSCKNDTVPKPRSYFRIDLPENEYVKFDSNYPYKFEYSKYSELQLRSTEEQKYWMTIYYPVFDGSIHITYIPINNNLDTLIEDAYKFITVHMDKASDIPFSVINDPEKKIHGLIYDIKGCGVASQYQFFITDSTTHFLRGALYFNTVPNNDSLAPVIDYISADINHFVETFEWDSIY